MKTIELSIVTPDGPTFKGAVESLVLPAFEGELGVLPGHMPLMCVLKAGELRYHQNGATELLAVSGGFAQVGPDKVTVLAETAELASAIDLARAKAKLAEKEEKLKGAAHLDEAQMALIQGSLIKELIRIRLAEKSKR